MTHLGWYYFGRRNVVPSQPKLLVTNTEGEWVRMVPRITANTGRTVKTMCNVEVSADDIIDDPNRVECGDCREIHYKDLSR
jgi:hypothetical protein